MKKHVAGLIWAICVALSLAGFGDPDLRVGVLCFWLGSAILAVNMMRSGKSQKPAKAKAPAQTFVSVALPRPARSPAVQEAYAAIPAYCFNAGR